MLGLCAKCKRHARTGTCPFCGNEIGDGAAVIAGRLARTALVALAAGCAGPTPAPADPVVLPPATITANDDAGAAPTPTTNPTAPPTVVAAYGAPAPTGVPQPADAGAPPPKKDAGVAAPHPTMAPMYGIAPVTK